MTDTLTIRGFVGNDPQSTTTAGGTPVLNFRVGSSQRRFDARSGEWIDMGTNWYSVSAYRQLAEHARASLRKGDAVIVSGRLKLREWESVSGHKGASFDLDADAIGHDLRWGTSNFVKTPRPPAVDRADGRDMRAARARQEPYDADAPSDADLSEEGRDEASGEESVFDVEAPVVDEWSQSLIDQATGEVSDTAATDAA